MYTDRFAHFELPPQWSTMREAARLKKKESGLSTWKRATISPRIQAAPGSHGAMAASLKLGYVRYSPGADLAAAGSPGRGDDPQGAAHLSGRNHHYPRAKFGIAATFYCSWIRAIK